MGKSQLTSASLCEHVPWLRAYLLISYSAELAHTRKTDKASGLRSYVSFRLRPLSHIQLSVLVVPPAPDDTRSLARDLACFILAVRATLETPDFLFAALGPGGART